MDLLLEGRFSVPYFGNPLLIDQDRVTGAQLCSQELEETPDSTGISGEQWSSVLLQIHGIFQLEPPFGKHHP